MFTRDLEMCLMAAQSEAKDRHHEYLCVEHILYALLHHDTGTVSYTHLTLPTIE